MAEQRILGCRCQGVRIRTCRVFNCCLDSCEVFHCVCARGCFSCSSSNTLSFWCMCPWWWDDLKPESFVRLKSCRLQLIFTTRLPIPVLKFSQSKIEAKQAVRRTFHCFSTSSNSSTHTHTHTNQLLSLCTPPTFKSVFIICTASSLQLKVDYLWTPSGTGGESRHSEIHRNKVLPQADFLPLPPPL